MNESESNDREEEEDRWNVRVKSYKSQPQAVQLQLTDVRKPVCFYCQQPNRARDRYARVVKQVFLYESIYSMYTV